MPVRESSVRRFETVLNLYITPYYNLPLSTFVEHFASTFIAKNREFLPTAFVVASKDVVASTFRIKLMLQIGSTFVLV